MAMQGHNVHAQPGGYPHAQGHMSSHAPSTALPYEMRAALSAGQHGTEAAAQPRKPALPEWLRAEMLKRGIADKTSTGKGERAQKCRVDQARSQLVHQQ